MWKVMLADDEPYIREGMQKLIPWQELGCELCFLAKNGRELLKRMETERPDIVIVDVRMPVMGGLEVAKYIAEHRLDIPVIVLTAYADFQYAKEAIQYKVAGYVVKTSVLDEMPEVLRRTAASLREQKTGNYRLLVFLHDGKHNDSILKMVQSCFEEVSCSGFMTEKKEYCIVLAGCVFSEEELRSRYHRLRETMKSFWGYAVPMGISEVYYDAKEAAAIAGQTREYLRSHLQEGGQELIFAGTQTEEEKKGIQGLVQRFIEENYCSRLTLDDIAEQAHLNKSYLSRLYKQKTGENLFDAINRLRIAKAREYIQAQSHMIYEVAGMVGFDDNAYFSRVFKKYTGMSPKEYEKRVKEGQGI